ncbi:SRPBCC family protein [Nocardioides sp. TF02-7]|uniref:SRPBCC family protein n=1 Tax=Nocardioides sp. TF02-7 TaxID=2917724 RepID=UPI001F0516B4|nr:SRPBCC family protein [Nocardioides sp. TF02-7]UMG94815.1 SRPBCC family protein [Nocardioides sp. TF02-7]
MQHGRGRPGPLELQASVTVNRSPEDVYAFWRSLENLPRFMLHLQTVEDLGGGRSRWRANAPLRRRSVGWEAEITSEEPGRRLAWKSLPGADVDNAGTVHFGPTPDGRGTEVKVVLHYDVPGGRVGRAVARLLGENPVQQVRDDLRRFKQVMETGDVVRTEALPEGTDARHQVLQRPGRALKGGVR